MNFVALGGNIGCLVFALCDIWDATFNICDIRIHVIATFAFVTLPYCLDVSYLLCPMTPTLYIQLAGILPMNGTTFVNIMWLQSSLFTFFLSCDSQMSSQVIVSLCLNVSCLCCALSPLLSWCICSWLVYFQWMQSNWDPASFSPRSHFYKSTAHHKMRPPASAQSGKSIWESKNLKLHF